MAERMIRFLVQNVQMLLLLVFLGSDGHATSSVSLREPWMDNEIPRRRVKVLLVTTKATESVSSMKVFA